MSDENQESPSILQVLLPYLIVTAIASIVTTLAVLRFAPVAIIKPSVVVFDVVKLANAERAIASNIIAKNDKSQDSSVILAQVGKRAESSISKIAGPNTIVLVKQAVVGYNLPDITDAVLKDLDLPLDSKTYNTSDVVLKPTPDGLLNSPVVTNTDLMEGLTKKSASQGATSSSSRDTRSESVLP